LLLTLQHANATERTIDDVPLVCDIRHPAQHLKFAVDAGYFKLRRMARRDVRSNQFARDFIERLRCQFFKCKQIIEAVFVIALCFGFCGECCANERSEPLFAKLGERWNADNIPDC
jgi:hypothetical protein